MAAQELSPIQGCWGGGLAVYLLWPHPCVLGPGELAEPHSPWLRLSPPCVATPGMREGSRQSWSQPPALPSVTPCIG